MCSIRKPLPLKRDAGVPESSEIAWSGTRQGGNVERLLMATEDETQQKIQRKDLREKLFALFSTHFRNRDVHHETGISATSAKIPSAARHKSTGFNSIWHPRRPPLTTISGFDQP
ncbi:hypothetical protein [Akkermansia muciniphila]|uniref:hypothetical protein n=1 Tax=Akkermansia muciniphila TaxID=239935 RepID=UPI001177A6D3|nr:hypothetical protein [Akkermansia muciniphila]